MQKLNGSYQDWREGSLLVLKALASAVALLVVLFCVHRAYHFASPFQILYFLPIWLASRLGGRFAGFVLVLLATLATAYGDWSLSPGTGGDYLLRLSAIRFASYLAILVATISVEAKLAKHQAAVLVDPLTGLFNRRALQDVAVRWPMRKNNLDDPMTLVMIDCDGFKQINDRHGHAVGDHVLQMLARVLQSHTRRSDMVVRFGGDEFVLVLEHTGLTEAVAIMDRIREYFSQCVRDAGYDASISFGCASPGEDTSTLAGLLETADRKMFSQKNRTRRAYLR